MPKMVELKQSEKKKRILEAAAKLFRDKGYSATSMRDLAAAVDLKASSLYNHIGSKEEILKEICFANAERFLNGIKKIDQDSINPLSKITNLIHLHIDIALEDFTSVTSFNDEWRQLSEPHLSTFSTMRKNYEEKFLNIIRKAQQGGQIKSTDAQICLYTILSSTRWVYDYSQHSRVDNDQEIKSSITEILIKGLSC